MPRWDRERSLITSMPCCCSTTKLSPIALLDAMQQIEQEQGRVRDIRWGPRTLDLDLLLYGDMKITSPTLTVPHPRMQQRNFVLYPLREISDTNLVLPDGSDLDTLLRQCPDERSGENPLPATDKPLHEKRVVP